MQNALIGVWMMHTMVSEAYGGSHAHSIKPRYQFSTDDTVVYIFEEKGNKQVTCQLVSSKLLKTASNQAKYKIVESNIIE